MTKYKEYFNKMFADNKEVFEKFRQIHDAYALDENNHQEELNKKGAVIQEIIREYENRLCANTERGMYNKFSAGLAEKFQDEVRRNFPMIDHIGLKVQPKASTHASANGEFVIKKITLN